MSLENLVFQAPLNERVYQPSCQPSCQPNSQPRSQFETRSRWVDGRTVDLLPGLTSEASEASEASEVSETRPAEREGRPTLWPIVVLVFSLVFSAIGCAKPPEHPWVVRDGLIEVETYNRGQLFVKRDHNLGDYDNLLIDHVGFRYGRGQERLKDGAEDRIVSMLLGAVQGSQDGTIGLAALPGPCVLTVNFFLKDLEFETAERNGGSETNFVSSYGAATMVLELRDSMDQEPLARFIQRRDLGGGRAMQTQSVSLHRLRHVMSYAIRDMGNQLRKVIPPSAGVSNVSRKQCRGGMSEVALGSR